MGPCKDESAVWNYGHWSNVSNINSIIIVTVTFSSTSSVVKSVVRVLKQEVSRVLALLRVMYYQRNGARERNFLHQRHVWDLVRMNQQFGIMEIGLMLVISIL